MEPITLPFRQFFGADKTSCRRPVLVALANAPGGGFLSPDTTPITAPESAARAGTQQSRGT